jgi:hypothetical protein
MAELNDTRVAVYIDFDNIVISRYDQVYGRGSFMANKSRNGVNPKADADPDSKEQALRATVDVGAILDYATSFGTVVISRAFADWSVPANSRYSRQLVDRAVDLTQLFPTALYTKNGADIRLSVDVIEDMFRLPDITHVVIVAGDSDFIPLAQRCKRLGRHVIGIGVAGATSRQLAAACDEFAYYGDLPGVMPERAPQPAKVTVVETLTAAAAAADNVDDADAALATVPDAAAEATKPPASAAEPATDQPAAAPAKKRARRASSPALEVAAEPEVDPDAIATDLLIRAMRLSHAKTDDEWLHSGGVKSQMQRMDPSFNEKSLGFKSFSDFVKSRGASIEQGKGNPAGRIKLK